MLMKSLILTVMALSTTLVLGADSSEDKRPRVFVTQSESWSIGGELGIPDFSEGTSIQGGAKPQTAEIVKTVNERCPGVVVTRKEESADYVLVLEHEGGKIFVRKDNKFALYNADGDAIASGSTRSLGNAIKDACEILIDDWYEPEQER
ncbi:MAG TPA: hypothetical protein VEK15_07870 [Vicinamibacteria bacterium]|nr:hypothetical protein [Vicinamibacteria bacterium]